jgi:acyl-CoA synthetase (AMP-forming)/AMP-acid ligase II
MNVMTLEELVRPFGVKDAAVTFVDDAGRESCLTYDELARRAAAVAVDLGERGVRPGDQVALALANTPASVVAQMGTWMAGASILSIPPPPRNSEAVYRDGFASALRAAECRLLVGSARIAALLEDDLPTVITEELSQTGTVVPPDQPVPVRPLVQFSSGSTGRPKGIVLSASALEGHLTKIATAFQLDRESDRGLSWLPLYHDMGFVAMWLTGLLCRGNVTIMSPRYFARHPMAWLNRCAEERTTVTAVPDFCYRLASRMVGVHPPTGSLSALRVSLSGAEPISWTTLESFAIACEPFGFRWEALTPAYGLAEATLAVSVAPLGQGPTRDSGGLVALGAPLPGTDIRTSELGGGDTLLELRGDSLFDGYLEGRNVRAATDEEGWFPTNDVGYIANGQVYVKGRADEVIIVRGRNIFAEDIESVAMTAAGESGVGAAAFRREHDGDRFALAIESIAGDGEDATHLARAVQGAVTTALETQVSPVVVLAPLSIPRTTSGKVRRPACREALTSDGWPDSQVIAVLW